MVVQSKAGRTSNACQGCFLSCQSNRLGNVHRQIPKLTLSSPIGFSGRRLRQGPSDQWRAVIIESLKEGEGGGGRGAGGGYPGSARALPHAPLPVQPLPTHEPRQPLAPARRVVPHPLLPSPLPQVVSLCLQTSPGLCFSTPAGPDVWVGLCSLAGCRLLMSASRGKGPLPVFPAATPSWRPKLPGGLGGAVVSGPLSSAAAFPSTSLGCFHKREWVQAPLPEA